MTIIDRARDVLNNWREPALSIPVMRRNVAEALVRVADKLDWIEEVGGSALGGNDTDKAYGMGMLLAAGALREAIEGAEQ